MSGSIGLIQTDLARYTVFHKCLLMLAKPVNTDIIYGIGSDFANNRNSVVQKALDAGSEWVFFVDDDMAFPPDHLLRLLSQDKPIVASLYTARSAPWRPIAYDWISDEDGWDPIDLTQIPGKGLVKVDGAGTGGMLIRTEVFHQMPFPWFEKTPLGSEDLEFCKKATRLGFEIVVDLEARMGHLTTAAIWPDFTDGQWLNGVVMADGTAVWLPSHESESVETVDAKQASESGRTW